MASFDKSYYDILKKYVSITEQKYQIIDSQTGQVISTLDQLPAGVAQAPKSTEQASFDARRAAQYGAPAGANAVNASANVARAAGGIPASSAKTQVGVNQQPNAAAAAPSQEELDLFKKIHGSSYNSSSAMDKAKFAQLQTAGKDVGGYGDVEKVRNAAYAQQYAGKPEGEAYAKKAGLPPAVAGVTPGKPGLPAGGTAVTSTPASPATQPAATPEQAVGVPAGTTPQQFDARRAAQTGVAPSSAPTAVASTGSSAANKPAVTNTPTSRPKNRAEAATAARKGTNKPTA